MWSTRITKTYLPAPTSTQSEVIIFDTHPASHAAAAVLTQYSDDEEAAPWVSPHMVLLALFP